jgi:hypothetical protein
VLDAPPTEEHPEDAPPRTAVPVLTRALAEILGRDPHPVVALGRRDHRLEKAAILFLDLAPASDLRLSLAEPHREPVAHPLELGDAEDAGPTDGGNAPVDARPRKGGGEELAEPLLERTDLSTQLLACLAVGDRVGDRLEEDLLAPRGRRLQ